MREGSVTIGKAYGLRSTACQRKAYGLRPTVSGYYADYRVLTVDRGPCSEDQQPEASRATRYCDVVVAGNAGISSFEKRGSISSRIAR